MTRALLRLSVILLLLAIPAAAAGTTITFATTDLPDSGADDLWQYSYLVSDRVFAADEGFTIFFDRGLFKDLQPNPPAPNPDWQPLTVERDLTLPSDGFYDALGLVDNASLGGAFLVSFTWLGPPGTTPGSQPFQVYAVADEVLNVLETGRTVAQGAAVPVPSTLLLLGAGLLFAAAHAGTRRR